MIGPRISSAAPATWTNIRRRMSPASGPSTANGSAQNHRGPKRMSVANHPRSPPRRNSNHTPTTAATPAASGWFLLFATVNECPMTAHIANGSVAIVAFPSPVAAGVVVLANHTEGKVTFAVIQPDGRQVRRALDR